MPRTVTARLEIIDGLHQWKIIESDKRITQSMAAGYNPKPVTLNYFIGELIKVVEKLKSEGVIVIDEYSHILEEMKKKDENSLIMKKKATSDDKLFYHLEHKRRKEREKKKKEKK